MMSIVMTEVIFEKHLPYFALIFYAPRPARTHCIPPKGPRIQGRKAPEAHVIPAKFYEGNFSTGAPHDLITFLFLGTHGYPRATSPGPLG